MNTNGTLASMLETFFTDRLMRQRQASPHTIASYADTFRLLLEFTQLQQKKAPSAVDLSDLDAPHIGAFLDYLERERGNSARTRNNRLAAIHSFFRYVAFREPSHSEQIQRVLAMPSKRYDRRAIEFLTQSEVEALLASPNPRSWIGRRDRTLLLVAVQTGLRVSELIGLRNDDVVLTRGAHVRCHGKGRKERCTPLRTAACAALRVWLHEQGSAPSDPIFPSIRGGPLAHDGVAHLLARYLVIARKKCPSLERKRVTPHVLRHTAAMDLLQHGVDRTVIALWLGHESIETTETYLHASLELKEKALEKMTPTGVQPGRYRPDDALLAFLKSL